MKYFNIDEPLNEEMQKRFTSFANENSDDDWTITIFCSGGMNIVKSFILEVINSRPEKVTLIAQEIYSAAFDLFRSAKCNKKMVEGAKGMSHLDKAEMYMMSNGKPAYFEDECILKNFKERKKKKIDKVSKYMSKNELSKLKKGDDVFFTFKRMREIFPDVEII